MVLKPSIAKRNGTPEPRVCYQILTMESDFLTAFQVCMRTHSMLKTFMLCNWKQLRYQFQKNNYKNVSQGWFIQISKKLLDSHENVKEFNFYVA